MLPGARPFCVPAAAFTAASGFGAGPMVNASAFEAPPPLDGLNTSTSAIPTFAVSAEICAVRCVASTTLLVRFTPFQRRVDPFQKFAPVTESESPLLPAFAVLGVSAVRVGLFEPEVEGK